MTRFRWLGAKWPESIRSTAKRLKAKPFNEDNTEGFVIDRVRDDFIEARYIERLEFSDAITDPFGHELIFPRVEFRQCEFVISTQAAGLELIDSPRNIQGMLSRLAEATDFLLAVSPLKIDVLAWANALQLRAKVDMVVDSLQIGSVELERDIQAKVIVKGRSDVRKAADLFVGMKLHSLEKIQLRIREPFNGTILLSDIGVAKIELEQRNDIVVCLRESLNSLLAK